MSWGLAAPEIFLGVAALAILMLGVFVRRGREALAAGAALAALAVAALLVTETAPGVGYGGLFGADAFAAYAKLLILAGAALSLLLAIDYNRRQGIGRYEFFVLLLLSTVGMMTMASAVNLMTLYLGLELQSLAIYVLAAFARDDIRSSEAGLKYFVLSALASGLLLYGISLTYGFAGSMQFDRIATALAGADRAAPGLVVGIAFIVAGLAFKLSAVPFHMWTPDVYEGAPTPVTAFMSTAPKVAPFVVLLRVMEVPFGHVSADWRMIIVIVSIGSMVLGSFAAIAQSNIKRLMAYSSIGHMGYALVGLAAGTEAGIRGVLIYLLVYTVMSSGSFACIIAMRRRGHAVERIADLSGLARNDLPLAALLAIFMFSMAGVPPLAGFFGKFYVFAAAVQQGMWTLAVIGVLTSVVSCYYYLRIVKVMFFDPTEDRFDRRGPIVSLVAVGTGLFTLPVFILIPAPFVGAAARAARALLG